MASAAERLSDHASEEKEIGQAQFDDVHDSIDNLPDPDAGLSKEERAIQVTLPHTFIQSSILIELFQDRKLLRKLDLKLIPWLSFLYLMSFLDRTNIGNAKVDGLQKDLHMTNGQYNESLTIFFVSYAVFEPVTNILLKKLRPRVFLTVIMVWCEYARDIYML
jgi:hypothetical protein